MLRRHGLGTRQKRLGLVAGYACPPDPLPRDPEPERHIEAPRPGSVVQLDAFAVGRLSGTREGGVAIRGYRRGFQLRPGGAAHLAEEVARDLAERGWKLECVMTDTASELRSHDFEETIAELGAAHRFIRAGRPQSNGCVERVQPTILEACWRPSFARRLIPTYTGLRHDLRRYIVGATSATTTPIGPTPAG